MNILLSLLLVGLVCNLVHSNPISTIRGSNHTCQYVASDGSFYNLQDLVLLKGSYSISNKEYKYDINICDYQTEVECTGKAAVCQTDMVSKVPIYNCGVPTKTHFEDGLLGPTQGVYMVYFGGDICAETQKPRILY